MGALTHIYYCCYLIHFFLYFIVTWILFMLFMWGKWERFYCIGYNYMIYMDPDVRERPLTHLPLDKTADILADDLFKCIFLNENYRIPIQISLKCVARSLINNKPALVQVMAWRRTGTSHYLNQCWPSSLTHICGTRGRWVKLRSIYSHGSTPSVNESQCIELTIQNVYQ